MAAFSKPTFVIVLLVASVLALGCTQPTDASLQASIAPSALAGTPVPASSVNAQRFSECVVIASPDHGEGKFDVDWSLAVTNAPGAVNAQVSCQDGQTTQSIVRDGVAYGTCTIPAPAEGKATQTFTVSARVNGAACHTDVTSTQTVPSATARPSVQTKEITVYPSSVPSAPATDVWVSTTPLPDVTSTATPTPSSTPTPTLFPSSVTPTDTPSPTATPALTPTPTPVVSASIPASGSLAGFSYAQLATLNDPVQCHVTLSGLSGTLYSQGANARFESGATASIRKGDLAYGKLTQVDGNGCAWVTFDTPDESPFALILNAPASALTCQLKAFDASLLTPNGMTCLPGQLAD